MSPMPMNEQAERKLDKLLDAQQAMHASLAVVEEECRKITDIIRENCGTIEEIRGLVDNASIAADASPQS